MNMMNLNNKSNRELNITTTPAPPSTPFPTPIPASSPTPANNNNNPHSPISKWSGHVLSMWPLRCTYSFVLFVILALFNLFDHCGKNGLSRGIFVWIRKDSWCLSLPYPSCISCSGEMQGLSNPSFVLLLVFALTFVQSAPCMQTCTTFIPFFFFFHSAEWIHFFFFLLHSWWKWNDCNVI